MSDNRLEKVLQAAWKERRLDARGVRFDDSLLGTVLSFATARGSNRPTVPDALFDAAIFPPHSNFRLTKFTDAASFAGASFAQNSSFAGAAFLGPVDFSGATFADRCSFDRCIFSGSLLKRLMWSSDWLGESVWGAVSFERALFGAGTTFTGATIGEFASFAGATFGDDLSFVSADVADAAKFNQVTFGDGANFTGARFSSGAQFDRAQFGAHVVFEDVMFAKGASFVGATCREGIRLGPLVCSGVLALDHVTFLGAADVKASVQLLSCRNMRVAAAATFEVRRGAVDLAGIRCDGACTLVGVAAGLENLPEEPVASMPPRVPSPGVTSSGASPQIVSFEDGDARNLAIVDIDLSTCRFRGAHNLDHLRLEGVVSFAATPRGWFVGWSFPLLWRWSRRRVIAEEHRWRAATAKRAGWNPAPYADLAAETNPVPVNDTVDFLRGTRGALETQARLRISDDALRAAVTLADPYFPGRHLPEKAFELLNAAVLKTQIEAEPAIPLPPGYSELQEEIERMREEKEKAIEEGDFQTAADCRDKERKLVAKRRELEEEWEADERLRLRDDELEIGEEEVQAAVDEWAGRTLRDSPEDTPAVNGRGRSNSDVSKVPFSPSDHIAALKSSQIGAIYRSLRKAREDAKDAPGAADFYYGEMEMRRHASSTSRVDRTIVMLYWLLSGYGLRASRALLALAVSIVTFAFLFAQWGFGAVKPGSAQVQGDSFVDGLIHSLESATFFARGNERALNETGEVLQVLLRVIGPLLLGLAVLAVRGRTKRE